MTRSIRLTIPRFSVLLLAGVVACFSPPRTKGADEEPKIDAKSRQVLTAYVESIKDLKSIEMKVSSEIAMSIEDSAFKLSIDVHSRGERPNRMYELTVMRGDDADGDELIICDGKQYYHYLEDAGAYVLQKAPPTLRDVVNLAPDAIDGDMGMEDNDPIGTPLLSDDPVKEFWEPIVSATYLGVEKIEGQECHHLEVLVKESKWELWLTKANPPIPRRIEPDLIPMIKKLFEKDGIPLGAIKVSAKGVMTIEEWKPNAKFTDADFEIAPAEGARKVALLYDEMTDATDPTKLIGRQAPGVDLETVDGQDIELGAAEDHVVLLVFWASWSEQSREVLAKVAPLAERYEARGLALQTATADTKAELARKALAEDKLKLPVALDDEGQAAEKYRVGAIPLVVLIGKDGRVKAVHLALAHDLEAKLSKQIEALLDDKPLPDQPAGK